MRNEETYPFFRTNGVLETDSRHLEEVQRKQYLEDLLEISIGANIFREVE